MDAAVSRRPGELVGEFAGGAGGLVDDGDELAAYFGGGVEQWGFELLAESSDGGFDVADHAVEAFARVLGGTADVFLHGGLEVGEADFAPSETMSLAASVVVWK